MAILFLKHKIIEKNSENTRKILIEIYLCEPYLVKKISYMNISLAHMQQVKRVLLVSTTARHRGATRELQVHLHCKQHASFHCHTCCYMLFKACNRKRKNLRSVLVSTLFIPGSHRRWSASDPSFLLSPLHSTGGIVA